MVFPDTVESVGLGAWNEDESIEQIFTLDLFCTVLVTATR